MEKKPTVLDFARMYLRKGWSPIPIPRGEKAPRISDWQNFDMRASDVEKHFDARSNIGIRLGEPSGNLVDVDLDCDEAMILAPEFLPDTGRIHGRESRPQSHWWYKPYEPIKSQKYAFEGECLLEIRSTGQQTVVPPSIHPTGENIRWEEKQKPAKTHTGTLLKATGQLAAAVLLVRTYPSKGSRNDFALALAGMLHRAEWDESAIAAFVGVVARTAEDEEWKARKRAARSTTKRMENGGAATGRPTLSHLIGNEVVDQVCEWLGVSNLDRPVTRSSSHPNTWPEPLAGHAYHGVIGKIVRAIEPNTESDPAAILVQLLTALGNCVGAGPYCVADGARQRANIFCLVVGQTSKARKGTSLAHVRHLMELTQQRWAKERIINGLSSGEGLIAAVQDHTSDSKKKDSKNQRGDDQMLEDKRAWVCETEFSRVLRNQRREGNILSSVMRQAWDSDILQTLTKNSPARARGAHISIVGHITQEELRRELSATDEANGYANRFLFVCAKRSKELPMGGKTDPRLLFEFSQSLRSAINSARVVMEIKFSPKAEHLWRERYSKLSAARPGMLGAITSRGEAQVLRLAMIYALLAKQKEIRTQHLRAAFEVWRYCLDSARYIFGESLGDKVADKILLELRRKPEGLSLTDIRNLFDRNIDEYHTNIALNLLRQSKLAKRITQETGGRPRKVWVATVSTP